MASPSLITELCSHAGVVWAPNDEFILPQLVLNRPALVRLLKHESASHSSAGASSSRPHTIASAPETIAEPDAEDEESDYDFHDESSSMLQRLTLMEQGLNEHRQEFQQFH